jgi:hypothetical protein
MVFKYYYCYFKNKPMFILQVKEIDSDVYYRLLDSKDYTYWFNKKNDSSVTGKQSLWKRIPKNNLNEWMVKHAI